MDVQTEFDKQLETLIQKGYPEAANITKEQFLSLVLPLKHHVSTLGKAEIDLEKGSLPFVIVIKHSTVSTEEQMTRILKDGKEGITKLTPHDPNDYHTIESVNIPTSEAYLLVDVDRGKEFLNVRPSDALITIQERGRSPLTIDEGVAVVTHFPEFLIKNNCFSLLASRHPKNKTVPAIWINGQKHPNLGWCWNGNPHTWLGSASCSDRLGE